MSSQTIYIKIDKNVLVHNRNITLGDIAKIECTDVGMLRKIRQKKVYSFQGTHAKKVSGIFHIKDHSADP